MIASIINTLSMPTQPISRHVAVIGAGAAGLAAARELRREGHKVVVFERENQIGGTWVYDSRVESDPLSIDPIRPVIHSSLYSSLRTNLPREVMGFKDYPFIPRNDKTRDPRRYPGHREVLLYLQDFAKEFELEEMVRFETEVVFIGLIEDSDKLKVTSKRKSLDLDFSDEVYDAVVVCNGHYTEPRCAQIPGIGYWPGKQIHSHNYRVPEPFKDKVVIVIGHSSSGVDISMEIAGVAKEVHVTARTVASETLEKQPGFDNLWLHSMIDRACEDGSVIFQNGKMVNADIILHCTGYTYHFPFLESGIVNVDDNRVEPLYKHVFPPALAPSLSFVGLPWKVIPFPMFEFQSKWIAGILSGRIQLPSKEEMTEDVRSFYHALEASNIPKRYTHNMGDSQFEYDNWLADQCGCEGFEEWRKQMYYASGKRKRQQPDAYRDQCADDQLIAEAYKDFSKYAMKGFSDICIS